MKKIFLILLASVGLLNAQVASVTVDANGNVLNGKAINFASGKLSVNGVQITGLESDASTTVKGVTELSVAPVSSSNPIAVGDNDSRNTNARIPTAHASTHASGGADPVTLLIAQITGLQSTLDLKAPLASPTFTGVPVAPTAAVDTNTTQVATAGFVLAQAANATPIVASTGTVGTSTRYARQDHVHPAQTSVTGNAGTATALQTARTINGTSFDGTANITVAAAAGTLTGTMLASNVTASSLLSASGGTFGTAAYASTGATSGTVPLLGTGGHLANATMPLGAQLYDNAGTPVIAADFGGRTLKNGAGLTILDFGGSELLDGAGVESVDWNNRYLLSQDGTTIVLNWAAADSVTILGNTTIYANGNFEAGGNIVGNLWDGTHLSLLSTSRQLIANDGSTVALDWSDPTSVAFFTDVIIMGSDGTFSAGAVAATTFTGDGSALSGVTPKVGSIGSVIAGTKTATGTATTTFTVTIGVTMANTTYKVTTEGDNALSSAVHYVSNKTTTTFDIVYLAGLTGAVSVDWILSP